MDDKELKKALVGVFKKSEGRLKSALEVMYPEDERLDKVKVVIGDVNWWIFNNVCDTLEIDNRREDVD